MRSILIAALALAFAGSACAPKPWIYRPDSKAGESCKSQCQATWDSCKVGVQSDFEITGEHQCVEIYDYCVIDCQDHHGGELEEPKRPKKSLFGDE